MHAQALPPRTELGVLHGGAPTWCGELLPCAGGAATLPASQNALGSATGCASALQIHSA